jgi:hypothetical protein
VTLQVSPRTLNDPTVVHLQTTQGALAAIRLFGTLVTSELQRWEAGPPSRQLGAPPGLSMPVYPPAVDLNVLDRSGSISPLAAAAVGLAPSPGHSLTNPPTPQRDLSESYLSTSQQESVYDSERGESDGKTDV